MSPQDMATLKGKFWQPWNQELGYIYSIRCLCWIWVLQAQSLTVTVGYSDTLEDSQTITNAFQVVTVTKTRLQWHFWPRDWGQNSHLWGIAMRIDHKFTPKGPWVKSLMAPWVLIKCIFKVAIISKVLRDNFGEGFWRQNIHSIFTVG